MILQVRFQIVCRFEWFGIALIRQGERAFVQGNLAYLVGAHGRQCLHAIPNKITRIIQNDTTLDGVMGHFVRKVHNLSRRDRPPVAAVKLPLKRLFVAINIDDLQDALSDVKPD